MRGLDPRIHPFFVKWIAGPSLAEPGNDDEAFNASGKTALRTGATARPSCHYGALAAGVLLL
jgi:hypothetical protein